MARELTLETVVAKRGKMVQFQLVDDRSRTRCNSRAHAGHGRTMVLDRDAKDSRDREKSERSV